MLMHQYWLNMLATGCRWGTLLSFMHVLLSVKNAIDCRYICSSYSFGRKFLCMTCLPLAFYPLHPFVMHTSEFSHFFLLIFFSLSILQWKKRCFSAWLYYDDVESLLGINIIIYLYLWKKPNRNLTEFLFILGIIFHVSSVTIHFTLGRVG